MNRPNRPEQPSLVTTAYLDDRLHEVENKLDTRFEQIDARFEQIDARLEQLAQIIDARFDRIVRDLDLRFLKFENRLAWKLVGTIVAMTAIFSAVVLIAGVD